jgi:hypothetical protein
MNRGFEPPRFGVDGPGARLAAAAAALVVDDGMEYPAAKRKAARDRERHGERAGPLPSNEQLEAAVREHIAIFHADTQPGELAALRELALRWMDRLAPLRPHLSGAAWRGTATRRSALHVDLYCDDPKTAEIELLNRGLAFDVDLVAERPGEPPRSVLTLAAPCPTLGGDPVMLHLWVRDLDEQRGALKPDAQGRSWRGDATALRRLLAAETGARSQGSAP